MSYVGPIITAATLLAHALLGCCWHLHGEGCGQTAAHGCTGHAAHAVATSHQCDSHASHSDRSPDRPGVPECDHPDCSYLGAEPARCPDAQAAPLLAGTLLPAVAILDLRAMEFGPPAETADPLQTHGRSCARRQVWLL
jgi:hypothetical protein